MSAENPNKRKTRSTEREPEQTASWFVLLYTWWGYTMILGFGYIRDYIEYLLFGFSAPPKGYAFLLGGFNAHYTRHVFFRIRDCWDRPIVSAPAGSVDVIDREGVPFYGLNQTKGKVRHCLNLGSYNYLGFSGLVNNPEVITDDLKILDQYSTTCRSPRLHYGTTRLHKELEAAVAQFLKKDDAIVYGMGYATNSTTIPAVISKGGLILSDKLNHASIAIGCLGSGATIKFFKHNDPEDLEQVLKQALFEGQPRTCRPWTKILIIVEGLYSMEGTIVRLPEFIAIKKKYKAYLYVDEAHSIGSLGKTGRGVCEYWGVDHSEVDILMGTFTKSFASCGGYIAADQKVIDSLRLNSYSGFSDNSIPPVSAQQILSTLRILSRKDGTDLGKKKTEALRRNSIYFRRRLKESGMIVMGDYDSPVIPVSLFSLDKMVSFGRHSFELDLAVVVVGFPATNLYGARARFCMSAAHTIPELEEAIQKLIQVAKTVMVDYVPNPPAARLPPLQIEEEEEEDDDDNNSNNEQSHSPLSRSSGEQQHPNQTEMPAKKSPSPSPSPSPCPSPSPLAEEDLFHHNEIAQREIRVVS